MYTNNFLLCKFWTVICNAKLNLRNNFDWVIGGLYLCNLTFKAFVQTVLNYSSSETVIDMPFHILHALVISRIIIT